MPPQTEKKPRRRGRPPRPPKDTQRTGSNGVSTESDVIGTHSGGNFDATPQDPAPMAHNPERAQCQELDVSSFPVTPIKFKAKEQSKTNNAQEAAAEDPRRPKTQKAKSQAKTAHGPKYQGVNGDRNTTPGPAPTTTGIFSETPSKLYAGPTFNASPAASSIPLPKFFSKSVPNVDKTTSLTTMLENEIQESSLESDASPSRGVAIPGQRRQTREESPLDLFFRADKEAKGQNSQVRPGVLSSGRQPPSSSNLNAPTDSPLRPHITPNHIRHHTDGSTNGFFPLEMHEPPKPLEQSQPIPTGQKSGYSSASATKEMIDPLHDKSMALKKLLNFSDPYMAQPGVPNGAASTVVPATPSSKPSTQRRSSARLSGTPPLFPNGLDGTTPDERQAALLALAEKQISMPAYPASQRPLSSSLRKEFKMPESPIASQNQQPPSTPTRHGKQERSTPATRIRRAPATTGHISTVPTMHSSNAQPSFATPFTRDPAMKSMEDDLRRILRLDAFTSDGVTGVKS